MSTYDALIDAVYEMTITRLMWWVEVESEDHTFESEDCVHCVIARYLGAEVGEPIYVETDSARLVSDGGEDSVQLPSWATLLIYEFDQTYAGCVPRQETIIFLEDYLGWETRL